MTGDSDKKLTRTAASDAVEAIGWRYLLATFELSVPVESIAQGGSVAAIAIEACGEDADDHLRIDIRRDRVELSLQTRSTADLRVRDTELAHLVSSALSDQGFSPAYATSPGSARPVQMLEMAIDAMDIPAIRPFWKAVMAYSDEPGSSGPTDAIVDSTGQLPAIWFQQMEEERAQRNRIHFDITVAHDEAERRVQAAIQAGGHLVDDSYARSFWVLADVEGNEVCVCTWTDRDERAEARGEVPS